MGDELLEWRVKELEDWRDDEKRRHRGRGERRLPVLLTAIMALTAVAQLIVTVLLATGAIR